MGLIYSEKRKDEHTQVSESFIAGILDKTAEITAFLNPITNSYDRLGSLEAPKYISWSHQNRSQLVRIPAETGEKTRMELRSPDPAVNPYLAFALILQAGLDGIENSLKLSEPLDVNLYTTNENDLNKPPLLPQTLSSALSLAKQSPFVKRVIGDVLLNKYVSIKESECMDFIHSENIDSFYMERYFKVL
jgi:glutamine synthetase